MKKVVIVTLFILIVLGATIFALLNIPKQEHEESEQIENELISRETLPTETFIEDHLLLDDGKIRTNFKEQEGGDLYLAESLGLWMQYLVLKEDAEKFAKAVETLDREFVLESGLISWRIENKERSDVNALIDDLRIVEALFAMGEKTNREDYIKRAEAMSEATLKYLQIPGYFVDFYDTETKAKAEELTISYLIPGAFSYMEKYDFLLEEERKMSAGWLYGTPSRNDFYPKSYDLEDHIYIYDEEINLIDQLYVALHIEQIERKENDPFYEWLQEEFSKNNKLYGRYDRLSKEAAVDYESVSVYALAILYSLEKKDTTFAEDLYEQMMTLQVTDDSSPYVGGYVYEDTTHSFDNLLALIAERTLRDEQVIQ